MPIKTLELSKPEGGGANSEYQRFTARSTTSTTVLSIQSQLRRESTMCSESCAYLMWATTIEQTADLTTTTQ